MQKSKTEDHPRPIWPTEAGSGSKKPLLRGLRNLSKTHQLFSVKSIGGSQGKAGTMEVRGGGGF